MSDRNQKTHKLLIKKNLLLPALLATLAWLGGAYYVADNVIAPRSATKIEAAAQRQVDRHLQVLRRFFDEYAQKLAGLGEESQNSIALQKVSAASTQVSLQYFDNNQVHVGAGENPKLNFALVDLLKRSQTKIHQPVEFLRTGGDNTWQLHSAIATEDGVVLATQPFSVFAQALEQLDSSVGSITLVQKFPDGPPQSLWRKGEGGVPMVSAAVSGTYLSIEFRPNAAFARQNQISAYWCYIVAVAGLLASLYLLLRLLPNDEAEPWEAGDEDTRAEAEPETVDAYSAAGEMDLGRHSVPPPPQQITSAEQPEDTQATDSTPAESDQQMHTDFPQHVFRAYDIRGVADKEIDEPFAYQLGRALGTVALEAGEEILLVARDGRNSSELLCNCLIEGILDSGCNSVNLGLVPSPVLYFACMRGQNTSSGVMVTASHNPAEYNGFKIVLGGRPLAEEKLQQLYKRMQAGPFNSGKGANREQDVRESYIDEIYNDIALAGQPHLVVDAGNGVTSVLAPRLFEQLGCRVTPLFCEIDGSFPNHAPDPSRPENLRALIEKVRETGANLGVALDGDGDRVTLISASGRIAWADQLVMLLARDILARQPAADVVFDVKSSRALGQLVHQYGGRPIMWKTGHAPMKTKMLETGAMLGGELSGHIFIKDRWFGFDDGIYAAARILEIMALREQSLDELLDSLPQLVSTPEILVPVEEAEKFALVERLKNTGDFGDVDANTIDGIRLEYPDGWGLVRASNTTAALTLRFEAESEEALRRIHGVVIDQLMNVAPNLAIPDWQLI